MANEDEDGDEICQHSIDSFEMVQLLPKERAFVTRGHHMGRTYQKIAKDFEAINLLIYYCKCFHFL